MLNLEQWLRQKRGLSMKSFQKVPDKKQYYTDYDSYRERAVVFDNAVIEYECRRWAREIIALG